MDWAKAKTILIVVIAAVDLFLGVLYYRASRHVDATLTPEFIESVKEKLGEKDIHVNAKIPTNDPKLGSLIVEVVEESPGVLRSRFFPGTTKLKEEPGEMEDPATGRILRYNGEGYLNYENPAPQGATVRNAEEARHAAMELLKSLGFETDDMRETVVLGSDKGGETVYELHYVKIYGDRDLEPSSMTFRVAGHGVLSMERQWLKVREVWRGSTLYIGTAPKALLALTTDEACFGKTISDIEICYFLDTHAGPNSSDKIRSGKTEPAWRIQFTDGTVKIVGGK